MNKNYLLVIFAAAAVIAGAMFWFRPASFPGTGKEYAGADVAGLPAAQLTETVELKNGDTYELAAGYVQKNINGASYRMLAYNGIIPGPLLKVPQGAEVTVNFRNDTDMKTLLHSHGVRMDNPFDGTQLTQREMEPGETFAYKLKFPDAGIYWYHPHVREDFGQELGLYGNFLVVPADANYWRPVNREVPLFLDDILIENGKIVLSKEGANHTLMGRFGNVMLVNGETDYVLDVQKGELMRFYITNASNVRPFRFALAGARMKRVGGDSGAHEREEWANSVDINPSERVVVEVLFDAPGVYTLQNRTPGRTYALGIVRVSDEPVGVSYADGFLVPRNHAETAESIEPFRKYFDKSPDKRITLSVELAGGMVGVGSMGHGGHMMPDGTWMGGPMMGPGSDGIEWEDAMGMMNAVSDTGSVAWKITDQDTGKENMDIDWTLKRGEPVKIRIFNDPRSAHPMQHPVHFHGQRFLVLERDSARESNLVWKDTVLVPSGSVVDILLDTSNPGEWMAHCHIAEHLEAGMMFAFRVE